LPSSGGAGLRDRALLLFLYNTGARVQEVAELCVKNLELGPAPRVHLHGKGDKWRTCPLWKETAQLLQKLLADHPTYNAQGPVFTSAQGRPLTRFGIYKIVCRHTRKLPQLQTGHSHRGISPHVFRHYLPFRTMSGKGMPAQYFGRMREVAHDIVLTPSISPMQGKGVHREVYHRLPSRSFASAGRPSRVTYRAVCEVTE
jgi:integrase